MTDAAKAFVPGHVTGFFTVDRADDSARTGSRGGGLALTDGVTVTVRPAETSRLLLDGERIRMPAVEGVLDAFGETAAVEARTDLPLAAGFGVSGATALGTALAASEAFGSHRSENELATVAHRAEVEADSGLGDVVAQSRGGAVLRLQPGAPAHNELDGLPARGRIEYVTFGGLRTEDVITGSAGEITAAGERALSTVADDPCLEAFLTASRRFARESGLSTDRIQEAIDAVDAAGGSAAMAMLGETVFAPGRGLTEAGYDPAVCRIDHGGARPVE